MKKNSQNIGDIFTEEGISKLKVSQILTFVQEGHKKEYKITKLTKKDCWVIPVKTYNVDEVKVVDKRNKK